MTAPCRHCHGTGAVWNRAIGTWEPCGCEERPEEEREERDPDEERETREEDRRLREEEAGLEDMP